MNHIKICYIGLRACLRNVSLFSFMTITNEREHVRVMVDRGHLDNLGLGRTLSYPNVAMLRYLAQSIGSNLTFTLIFGGGDHVVGTLKAFGFRGRAFDAYPQYWGGRCRIVEAKRALAAVQLPTKATVLIINFPPIGTNEAYLALRQAMQNPTFVYLVVLQETLKKGGDHDYRQLLRSFNLVYTGLTQPSMDTFGLGPTTKLWLGFFPH